MPLRSSGRRLLWSIICGFLAVKNQRWNGMHCETGLPYTSSPTEFCEELDNASDTKLVCKMYETGVRAFRYKMS
nr:unnamed protein product [Haemonchus contortus]